MKHYCNLYKTVCAVCLCCYCGIASFAQPFQCPVNIDFENGDFTNWECYTGSVVASAGQNVIQWSNVSGVPTPGRMEIIGPTDFSNDPVGGFPRHCPNNSNYSIKLGNNTGGHQAEGVSFTYAIPAAATKFSILYNYAIVLQSPGHQPNEQPRFRARVIDVATGDEINCVSFDFTASGSLPGFQSTGTAVYKDWTPVSVDLSAFAGQTIRLEFITSDCTFEQHYGYAYIDVNSDCNGNIKGSTYCIGDSNITLTAPYGYQNYSWYADGSFGQVINTAQQLMLPSSTSTGSVFPVIVNPYPGFGCLDTLYAIISSAARPVASAGADRTVCFKQSTQLGNTPNPNYIYSWIPATQLSNATIANPQTATRLSAATQYILKVTDAATSCFGLDTVLVTPLLTDTASSSSGSLSYCPGQPLQAVLTVSNPAAQVQWLRNNTPLSGSTGFTYQPGATGTYQAQILQSGCTDTSRPYTIQYSAVPKAGFTLERDLQCIGQPVLFTNTTTISGNEPLNYTWRFSNGGVLQTVNAERAFFATGVQWATLVAASAGGCTDSIRKTLTLTAVCNPVLPSAFTPNGDGLNDRLTPYLAGARSLTRFTIYDRYGRQLFSTTQEKKGWDGTCNGTPVQTGVFVWMLEYYDNNNQPVMKEGTVMLIR